MYYRLDINLQFFVIGSRKKGTSTEQNEQIETKLPKILDGTYFQFVRYTDEPNLLARCVQCGLERSAAADGTGNLVKHYRECHSEQVTELTNFISRKKEQSTTPTQKPDKEKVGNILIKSNQFYSWLVLLLMLLSDIIFLPCRCEN